MADKISDVANPPRLIAESVRSDDLADLRQLFAVFPTLAEHLGAPESVRLVLDANVVIADVRWLVKNRRNAGARTALQEALASRTLIAFAPPELDSEVRDRLSDIADRDGLDLPALLSEWDAYRRDIALCPTQGHTEPDVPVVDPKDLPYVRVYSAVGADAIMTSDHHLAEMQAKTVGLELAIGMRDYARAASIELTIKWHGTVLCVLGIAMLEGLATATAWVPKKLKQLPTAVQLAIGLAVVAAFVHTPTRKKILATLRTGGDSVIRGLRHAAPILSSIVTEYNDVRAQASKNWSQVESAVKPRKLPLRQRVLVICLASQHPLSVDEIERQLLTMGGTIAKFSRKYLRQVVRHHTQLVATQDGKWGVSGRFYSEPAVYE